MINDCDFYITVILVSFVYVRMFFFSFSFHCCCYYCSDYCITNYILKISISSSNSNIVSSLSPSPSSRIFFRGKNNETLSWMPIQTLMYVALATCYLLLVFSPVTYLIILLILLLALLPVTRYLLTSDVTTSFPVCK